MRALPLLLVVVLGSPLPAHATMSLAKAAVALCRDDDPDADIAYPKALLERAGVRGLAPLLDALATAPDGACTEATQDMAIDLLCEAQEKFRGSGVTPVFAPVRAALESGDQRRVTAALNLVGDLGAWTRGQGDEMGPGEIVGERCASAAPMLASAAGALGRLLDRTRGEQRAQVLGQIAKLRLNDIGAPLVPALTRLLDDASVREDAVFVLRNIGRPAARAAPRLGQLLAAGRHDWHHEEMFVSALVAIGAPSPAAAAALPARLDEAATRICDPGYVWFFDLFKAARASGPPPGKTRDAWARDLVARAQAALARLIPPCVQSAMASHLFLELSKLPPNAGQIPLLEAEMMDSAQLDRGRHFWAAWALRSLDARLPMRAASFQAGLLDSRHEPMPPLPAQPAPNGPLAKSALVDGMNAVRPKVAACYTRYQVPGTALVNVTIARSGKIAAATVTGKFAGTPTGTCVEQAVKSARFPPSDGLSTPYPFALK